LAERSNVDGNQQVDNNGLEMSQKGMHSAWSRDFVSINESSMKNLIRTDNSSGSAERR